MEYVEMIKNIAQIIFWVIAGVVAILTYRHARRTVLQPIKTEVFKAQLETMSHIYGIFLGKDEIRLRKDFAHKEFFDINFYALKDAYASVVFGINIDRETQPYNSRDCPRTAVLREEENPNNPTIVAGTQGDEWSNYNHPCLYLYRGCLDALESFDKLLENPLLPSRLATLIRDYRETMMSNLLQLSSILNDAAQEMPKLYKNLSDLQEPGNYWTIWNNYMHEFKHMKPKADEIVTFIRDYFMPDNLNKL